MKRRPRHRRPRRAVPIFLRVFMAGVILLVFALWMLAQRKPVWYVPTRIAAEDLPRLRREVTAQLDEISRKIVQREPFVVAWTESELTQRLAALRDLWPEAHKAWPAELSDPVVQIEEGSVLVGSLYERAGWRAVVAIRFSLDVIGDDAVAGAAPSGAIRFTLLDASVGSLSAPRWLLRRRFDSSLKRLGQGAIRLYPPIETSAAPSTPAAPSRASHSGAAWLDRLDDPLSVNDLFDGCLIDNGFTWPNGKRPFRVARIASKSGVISLHIEPR